MPRRSTFTPNYILYFFYIYFLVTIQIYIYIYHNLRKFNRQSRSAIFVFCAICDICEFAIDNLRLFFGN